MTYLSYITMILLSFWYILKQLNDVSRHCEDLLNEAKLPASLAASRDHWATSGGRRGTGSWSTPWRVSSYNRVACLRTCGIKQRRRM